MMYVPALVARRYKLFGLFRLMVCRRRRLAPTWTLWTRVRPSSHRSRLMLTVLGGMLWLSSALELVTWLLLLATALPDRLWPRW